MSVPILLLLSLVLIVAGALLFTNAVEWLGRKLNLGGGAVGSIFAAVGTALPESLIPIVAIVSGGEGAHEIAIGAVIGAPFMLATVAMLLIAASARIFRERRPSGTRIEAGRTTARRDLLVFGALFPIGVLVGLGTPAWTHAVAAIVLLVAYAAHAWMILREGGGSEGELDALFFDTTKRDPPNTWQIAAQFAVALAALVGGAELFVGQVEALAEEIGIEPLVIALVLAPLATELPEKANSVLWMREGKDALALGNVTGAMVFQATVPMAIVMLLIDWELERFAFVAAALAMLGAALAYLMLRRGRLGLAPSIAWAGLFGAFIVAVGVL